MSTSIVDLPFNEFEQMEEAWRAHGWSAEYQKLGSDAFRGRHLHTAIGASVVYRAQWRSVIQHHGLPPSGTVALATTLHKRGPLRFMGDRVGRDDVIVQGGDAHLDIVNGKLWDSAVVVLPEAELAAELTALTQRDPHPVLTGQGLARLTPSAAARVRAACRSYFDATESSLSSAEQAPPLLGIAGDLRSLLVSTVAEALFEPVPTPPMHRRREIVRKAGAYAADCATEQLRIPELCRELGVSERSLRYAFQDLVGTSPAAYLKRQRLNRVRGALREADPSHTLVKQVAYDHGFWHLGQFATDYKAIFGETPSVTLARNP